MTESELLILSTLYFLLVKLFPSDPDAAKMRLDINNHFLAELARAEQRRKRK